MSNIDVFITHPSLFYQYLVSPIQSPDECSLKPKRLTSTLLHNNSSLCFSIFLHTVGFLSIIYSHKIKTNVPNSLADPFLYIWRLLSFVACRFRIILSPFHYCKFGILLNILVNLGLSHGFLLVSQLLNISWHCKGIRVGEQMCIFIYVYIFPAVLLPLRWRFFLHV